MLIHVVDDTCTMMLHQAVWNTCVEIDGSAVGMVYIRVADLYLWSVVAATLEITLYGLKALFHYCVLVKKVQSGQSGDRIQVETRFSVPVQTDPEAHPTSYTMGTAGAYAPIFRSNNICQQRHTSAPNARTCNNGTYTSTQYLTNSVFSLCTYTTPFCCCCKYYYSWRWAHMPETCRVI
jgi:hypothetical protein